MHLTSSFFFEDTCTNVVGQFAVKKKNQKHYAWRIFIRSYKCLKIIGNEEYQFIKDKVVEENNKDKGLF